MKRRVVLIEPKGNDDNMIVEVKFNIDFDVEKIEKETSIKSIEELIEFIDESIHKDIEKLLKRELEDEGLISINNVIVNYATQEEEAREFLKPEFEEEMIKSVNDVNMLNLLE